MAIPDIPSRFSSVIVRGNAASAHPAALAMVWGGLLADAGGSGRRQADLREVTVSTGTITLIVVILVVVAIVAAVVSMRLRRRGAEEALAGPEYDRLVAEVGPRKARSELLKRRQRVAGLGIKSLSDERRAAYTSQWETAQEQFVDKPAQTVRSAGSLITAVAVDRGYEVADHDQLMADLSVYHGRHLDGYRNAWGTTERSEQATTEDLRQALLDYRALFFDLLESTDEVSGAQDDATAGVPQQRPWKQVTQGRHWKTQRQQNGDATLAESEQTTAAGGNS